MRFVWLALVWLGCSGDKGHSPGEESDADTDTDTDADADADADTDTGSPPVDIAEALRGVDGIASVEELPPSTGGYRAFHLAFTQPVDHTDPSSPTFEQHATLVHYGEDLPMTIVSTGYDDFLGESHMEPTYTLGTNQIVVEKRYYGQSRPDPVDWTTMTIEQIAADQHAIRESLGAIYGGPWIATGASMGGADTAYYQYYWPDDIAGSIVYVAPFQLEEHDDRYLDWFATVPDPDCQAALEDYQAALLGERRAEMLDQLEQVDYYGYTLDRVGGLEAAYEITVMSLSWGFWQYSGPGSCPSIPAPDASLADLSFAYWTYGFGLYFGSDQAMDAFDPYFWQVMTELGAPRLPLDHLEGLYSVDLDLAEIGLPPVDAPEPLFVARNPPIVDWIEGEADRMIFVYGELDPWTGGGVSGAGNPAISVYTVAGGNHYASISALPQPERDAAWATVEGWLGRPASPIPLPGLPQGGPRSPMIAP